MSSITESAKNEECQIRIEGVCLGHAETVVWCHANGSAAGKGFGAKSHDLLGAYGCAACHDMYDRRRVAPYYLTYDLIKLRFHEGHMRSLLMLIEKGVGYMNGLTTELSGVRVRVQIQKSAGSSIPLLPVPDTAPPLLRFFNVYGQACRGAFGFAVPVDGNAKPVCLVTLSLVSQLVRFLKHYRRTAMSVISFSLRSQLSKLSKEQLT